MHVCSDFPTWGMQERTVDCLLISLRAGIPPRFALAEGSEVSRRVGRERGGKTGWWYEKENGLAAWCCRAPLAAEKQTAWTRTSPFSSKIAAGRRGKVGAGRRRGQSVLESVARLSEAEARLSNGNTRIGWSHSEGL